MDLNAILKLLGQLLQQPPAATAPAVVAPVPAAPAQQTSIWSIVAMFLPAVLALIQKLTEPKPITLPPPAAGPLPPGYGIPGDEPIKDPTKPPATPPSSVGRPTRGQLAVIWLQYKRDRFPLEYTTDNPFGLYKGDDKKAVLSGAKALNYGSKVRLDSKFYDAANNEITPAAVQALGLSWKMEWHVVSNGKHTWFKGKGSAPVGSEGKPYVDFEEGGDSGGIVGFGGQNYTDTHGFDMVVQAFGEGQVEIWAQLPPEFGSIRTQSVTFKVS